MIVGEDRNKVQNIVRPHIDEFHGLYASAFHEVQDRVARTGDCFHQVKPYSGIVGPVLELFDLNSWAIILLFLLPLLLLLSC